MTGGATAAHKRNVRQNCNWVPHQIIAKHASKHPRRTGHGTSRSDLLRTTCYMVHFHFELHTCIENLLRSVLHSPGRGLHPYNVLSWKFTLIEFIQTSRLLHKRPHSQEHLGEYAAVAASRWWIVALERWPRPRVR